MKKFLLTITTLLLINFSFAQAPDFTFTDTHGDEHNLYNTLDAGNIVFLDFFFVDCPPCRAWVPTIEEIFQEFGAGSLNSVFWGFSDRDDNAYIDDFKTDFNLNFPSGGPEGGAEQVINLYAANYSFLGFPTYSVVCPDRSITWDIWPLTDGAPEVKAALEACGASVATGIEESNSIANYITAYPNPASDFTNIEFDIESSADINISIYNILGEEVLNVANEYFTTGKHAINIDLSSLVTGNYFIRLIGENNQADVVKINVVK